MVLTWSAAMLAGVSSMIAFRHGCLCRGFIRRNPAATKGADAPFDPPKR